ncbi:DoxX family protein [Mitsuaria sp. TWR114]|jgi:putative oxidoreductase|uniref:DoxX family protein n=1 Tax=unclassified Roseateles TaxID=2626991 RepID=UPI0008F436C7|nr:MULTISPECIES: DoxX family protein [unclassified Roseateles]MBB3281319.1 putative oxidoreductase [Mitsuaria sp. BK037]TXD91663.1 DoxX family protein [Mitsuaria sp. TWR114]SFR80323.1 putative oxidoreductase [Mitsuaria sp. PDC51]
MNTTIWAPRALTALRIVAALLFIEHAAMKFLQFPAPVPGMTYPLPTILIVAGAIEVITSVLMIIGFQTRIAAFVASGEMAAAYFMAHAPQTFWPVLNMGEPAILFCFIFLYVAAAGGGALTLDNARRVAAQ